MILNYRFGIPKSPSAPMGGNFARFGFPVTNLPITAAVTTQFSGDLDRSGNPFARVEAYLGPSLGRLLEQIKPTTYITVQGTYTVLSASIFLVNVAGSVTINLPDVRTWMKQPAYQPVTAFERSIWVKDLGGNAAAFPITINPFGGQFIDGLAGYTIISNHALIRLYPLNDLSGWYVA